MVCIFRSTLCPVSVSNTGICNGPILLEHYWQNSLKYRSRLGSFLVILTKTKGKDRYNISTPGIRYLNLKSEVRVTYQYTSDYSIHLPSTYSRRQTENVSLSLFMLVRPLVVTNKIPLNADYEPIAVETNIDVPIVLVSIYLHEINSYDRFQPFRLSSEILFHIWHILPPSTFEHCLPSDINPYIKCVYHMSAQWSYFSFPVITSFSHYYLSFIQFLQSTCPLLSKTALPTLQSLGQSGLSFLCHWHWHVPWHDSYFFLSDYDFTNSLYLIRWLAWQETHLFRAPPSISLFVSYCPDFRFLTSDLVVI